MTYFGTVCLSIVAAAFALAGNAPMQPTLRAASVCGVIGSIFVAGSLLCQEGRGGGTFVILSMMCSAMGTTCVVAGMQDWIATALTCISTVGTVGVVLVSNICGSQR